MNGFSFVVINDPCGEYFYSLTGVHKKPINSQVL
jgi:hypothetical protein